ncbi:MAG: hypothetical protein VST71_05635 [Nitrospirota bacterium]|nr:hypothetical protein [Nitrospirota bacterium]
MEKLILMTVGTSVFDASKSFNNADTNRLKNAVEVETSSPDIENDISNAMIAASLSDRFNLTAEMASLIAFNERHPLDNCDWIVLLHSEDKKSEVCAHINAQAIVRRYFDDTASFPLTTTDDQQIAGMKNYFIMNNGGGVGIVRIDGLSPGGNETQFINALSNLEETIKDVRGNFPHRMAYFNVTGGLKGVIPLTTVLSIQKNMYIFYMHEESDGLFLIDYQKLRKIIIEENGNASEAFIGGAL